MKRTISVVALATLLFGTSVTAVAAVPEVPVRRGAEFVPGEVLVRWRRGLPEQARAAVRAAAGLRSVRRIPVAEWELLRLSEGHDVASEVAELQRRPEVAAAEPNYVVRAAATPNDPAFPQQWGLHNSGQTVNGVAGTADADIDATEAWDISHGSSATVVAVVDSGIDPHHPDLAANLWTNPGESGGGRERNGVDDDGNGLVDDWRGWDWIGRDNFPQDTIGHGTHVAGIIGAAGNDGSGVAGTSWNVDIMPLRVIGADGGSSADVASAFAYAAAKGARVVNASLGGPNPSQAIADAITSAPTVLFVAAAGNESSNNDVVADYPCNVAAPNVVCVAASDQGDRLASFSNYGATTVDLAAPGANIVSTVPVLSGRFADAFDGDLARWTTGGTNNSWARAPGGFVSDSVVGPYLPLTDSWIRTAGPVDLSGHYGCEVELNLVLDVAPGDRLAVEASSDTTTWTRLTSWAGSTRGQWVPVASDLSNFDGTAVYVRFRLVSDATDSRDGASIDDVSVWCLRTPGPGEGLAPAYGTSMAAPFVTGTAALGWAAAPATPVDEMRSAILRGVDVVSSLQGTTVTGGRLNARTTLGLLTGTPAPTPTPTPSAAPSPSPSPVATTPSQSPSPTDAPTPSPTETPAATPTSPKPEPTPTESAPASPAPPSSPSPSTSPSPSPSPTASVPDDADQSRDPHLEARVRRGNRRLRVSGMVAPADPGASVRVILSRRTRAGRFAPLARRVATLSGAHDLDLDGGHESSFKTAFARPRPGRCRIVGRYDAGDGHGPIRVIRRFRC